jgi:nucleotide-binding universal stress UspA family protein
MRESSQPSGEIHIFSTFDFLNYSQPQAIAHETAQILSGTIVAQTTVGGRVVTLTKLMKIESILCPTDLSADSDEALRYAVALSRAYNAQLLLLHCNTGDLSATTGAAAAQTIREALVRYWGSPDLNGLDWKSLVVTGEDVGEAISREAAIYRVDLIVMRSRRRPHRAALLGSTAEAVSRTAPCPVLVMHKDERDWVTGSGTTIDLKRILVAYDFSDYSELALKSALSFAQEYQSELHLLHVLPPFTLNESEISWYPLGREGAYHQAARRLQRVAPAEAYLWCEIKHAVSEGQPYREILDYAEKRQIDLICLGAHGSGFGMRTLFGSNVDRVLRQAPCPVLVTRPLKPANAIAHEAGVGITQSLSL